MTALTAVCTALLLLSTVSQLMAAEKSCLLTATDIAVALDHQEEEDVAVRLCSQGRYKEAEALFQRVLQVKEHTPGANNPALVTTLGSLAWCYFQQGKSAQAETLFQHVLSVEEKALWPDHPGLAITLDSLAALHVEQGVYAEAEALYRRALAVREKTLGNKHHDVATSLNNLAILLYAQGRSVEAVPLIRRALAILKKHLPAGHPKLELYQQNYDEINRRVHERSAR